MLSSMPHDVWACIAASLPLRDVGQVAPCCKVTTEEASDAEFWFHVFMRSCWPRSEALLAFAEGGSADPTSVDWRARLVARAKATPSIVVDIGRGYSKYGIVHGVRGRPGGDGEPPRLVQHCSSMTHPSECDHRELMSFIHRELDAAFALAAVDPSHAFRSVAVGGATPLAVGGTAVLSGLVSKSELNGHAVRLKSFNEGSGRWEAKLWPPDSGQHMAAESPDHMLLKPQNLLPVRSARELPLIIGEPFAATASRGQSGEYDVGTSSWARSQLARLTSRPGPVHIVPQAQMSLWALGVDHGIVVNIGQGQTIAIPVVDGQVGASVACCSDTGSGDLTQLMRQLMSRRFDWIDGRHVTFCRDLKEEHCYVAPPSQYWGAPSLRARIAAGEDVGIRPVLVDGPETEHGMADAFELAVERVLVPELFFDPEMGGRPTLPELVINCAAEMLAANSCDAEGARRLLRQVVLVGGAADIPGIRPRTEHEVRALLINGRAPAQLLEAVTDPNDVFVLNPPRVADVPLTSPRFVPFVGGCVRAVSSGCLLPLAPSVLADASQQHGVADVGRPLNRMQGLRLWASRNIMNLHGPAIFRTGGGGGEDDRIWHALRLALVQAEETNDDDEDDEDEQGENDESHDLPEPDAETNDDDDDDDDGETETSTEARPLMSGREMITRPSDR